LCHTIGYLLTNFVCENHATALIYPLQVAKIITLSGVLLASDSVLNLRYCIVGSRIAAQVPSHPRAREFPSLPAYLSYIAHLTSLTSAANNLAHDGPEINLFGSKHDCCTSPPSGVSNLHIPMSRAITARRGGEQGVRYVSLRVLRGVRVPVPIVPALVLSQACDFAPRRGGVSRNGRQPSLASVDRHRAIERGRRGCLSGRTGRDESMTRAEGLDRLPIARLPKWSSFDPFI
jgi:hypothetical protein